jgi:hypothetical protein
MFGFNRKKTAPPLCPGNPGVGAEAKIAFANGERSWTEAVDLVDLAAVAFQNRGYKIKNEKTWLRHTDSGFVIQPQFVEMQPLDNGGVRTTTTIQINHATLAPEGVFEYQHAGGSDVAGSISSGLDQWLQTDFVTLLDALRAEPQSCMAMNFSFPADGDAPARARRAVLGPAAHYMQNPPNRETENVGDEHPFCPCCLLTNSFEAFRDLIEGNGFYCLRLFAARNPDGTPEADCRVNGEDWESGAQALREYANNWAPAGYEFRKQYIILQNPGISTLTENG